MLQIYIEANLGGATIWINLKITDTNFIMYSERIVIEILKHTAFFDAIGQFLDVWVGHQIDDFIEIGRGWKAGLEESFHLI